VRGVRGVAHQDDMAPAVEMAPVPAHQALEIDPGRAAQVAGVRHQLRAAEHLTEQILAERDRGVWIGVAEAMGGKRLLGGLDDEGRGRGIELVDMGLEPAVFGAAEVEREGVEVLLGAEPDEAVRPYREVRFENIGVAVAQLRIDAIAGHDQVGVGKLEVTVDLAREHQLDAKFPAAPLQDVEQALAANADEAVAGRAHAPTLDENLDVVPVVECGLDPLRGRGVAGAHVLHCGIGEHHAPAEGVVWPVALDHRYLMRGMRLLHQEAEIETCRTAADTDDAHVRFLFSSGCALAQHSSPPPRQQEGVERDYAPARLMTEDQAELSRKLV
jgi:hypothetical protein